jgi:hypothetical protein
MTPEQQRALDAYVNGGAPAVGQNLPGVQVNPYSGCNQGGGMGSTQYNRAIDISQANKEQCGIYTLYVDTSSTSISGNQMLTLGGGFGLANNANLAIEYGNFPSGTTFLFDVDVANVIGGKSANHSPLYFIQWLDYLFADKHFLFARLDAKDNAGTAASLAAFATFQNNSILKRTIIDQGNWGVVAPSIEGVFCDPCLQDDDTRASWIGRMPVSGHDVVAISLTNDLIAKLEFCVEQYENARNMTLCGPNA